jgi:hypothetical protein
VTKLRKIRYGNKRGAHRVLVGKPEGKDHLQDVDGRKGRRKKWIFKGYEGGDELD